MKLDPQICCVESGKQELLLDLVSGKLTPDVAASIQRHAARCVSCSEFIALQAEVWAALEADGAPAVSPSFDANLYLRIDRLESESWWRRAWRSFADPVMPSFARPAAAVSLALALVIGVVVTRPPQTEMTPAASQSAVVVNTDVEAMEETLQDFEMLQALGDLPRTL